ncbi:hypothetical protein GCM10011390_30580 [Aureimonas endophytica]|uniref:Lipoprotein n=2 Tax=Aureimonas endophytica TaxID=2027858 RepID=A0A917E6Z2_9HYPH|nr:hypothetical protein GCM10011390_30580 [Aureimonas endophytica]
MSLSACVTGGGTPANGGAALSASQAAFIGDWSGNLPGGKPVRIVVGEDGGVSYYYQNQVQKLSNVKLTSSRLSMTVGTNGSTASMTQDGTYTFIWGPTGETTRATLRKS